jgi:sugar/nucleoside kinase (ribokinase family)
VSFDVAIVGAPFLDVTFEGLPRLPGVGEEVCARALHVGPGGAGMQAIGAARLGLSAALVAPLPGSAWGGLLRNLLESEGVVIVGADRSGHAHDAGAHAGVAITALLSTPEGVAMATVLGESEPRARDVERVLARGMVLSIGNLALAPGGATIYAVTGGLELPHIDDAAMRRLSSTRALILNAAEATALTGKGDPRAAVIDLARYVPTAVVTMGPDGAIGAQERRVVGSRSPQVDVADATGAGDLFVSAYVWADLNGADLTGRLNWACLYASLSVRAPTAFTGALALELLLAEGETRGLSPPPRVPTLRS